MTAASEAPLLAVDEISKRFGGVRAIDVLSFEVPRSIVLGIIGPNGSGKTTLVNLITGFERPDRGRVRFMGRSIASRPPSQIAGLGIARTFQTARPFHRLSAMQSLVVPLYSSRARRGGGRGRWGDRRAVAMDLLEEVGFERDSAIPTSPAATLPQGYLRRLELARCLALEPEVIITDELFSGLSPAEIASLLPLIDKLHVGGVTLILVEHRLRELFRVAQRVLVMNQGRKVLEGTPEAVACDARVRDMYLGIER